jgi:TonB family protein
MNGAGASMLRAVATATLVAAACSRQSGRLLPNPVPSPPIAGDFDTAVSTCPVTARDTLELAMYVTVADTPATASAVGIHRETVLQEAMRHWVSPSDVSIPALAQAALDMDDERQRRNPVLRFEADLTIEMSPTGRVTEVREVSGLDVTTILPALRATIFRADSSGAFGPPPADTAPSYRRVPLRIVGVHPSVAVTLPASGRSAFLVARLAVPFVRADAPAAHLPGTGSLSYPRDLKADGIEGDVDITFIVEPTGRAHLPSVRVVRASHADFVAAVRRALPAMRFVPATAGGCQIGMVMRQQFSFRLQRH